MWRIAPNDVPPGAARSGIAYSHALIAAALFTFIMSEPSPPEEELEKENKFAGESFGTDNVRTVYAGSSNDTKERESRIIILVGPSGTGKSTLIDCMCNYFYGAKINDPIRYKIADERFDNTTPKKSIIKYVFNGTDMPYRPIVIDTPGIGDPSGVKTDDELKGMIRNWLAFDPRSHIHVVGLVIPASMTRLTPRSEIELQHTLGLFPRWMHANVVPMVTKCDGAPEPSAVILRHFDLHNHRRFRFNTSALYQKPSGECLSRFGR
uniref:RNA polymerase II-associated factor 1 homolog n=1 Tax=Steinernema glaseri TaxID=37863 RepID=A0A1I7ZZT8_9BILA